MENLDVSNITVRVIAGHRHNWAAGQTLQHRPEHHETLPLHYTLWLIRQGRVEVKSEAGEWRVESGDAFLLPLHLRRFIVTPVATSWLSLQLRISAFNQFDLLRGLPLPLQWRAEPADHILLETWMDQILLRRRQPDAHHQLVVQGLANALLGLCWPHLCQIPLVQFAQGELPHWLAVTLNRIAEDPACTIAALAQEAGFSPAQFRRSFRKWVGMAPHDYLAARRLEKARQLLEATELPVRAIALRIGLHSDTHFAQLFRQAYGLSPSQYRASIHE